MPNLWIKSPAKFRIGNGNSSDMIPQKKRRGRMIAGPQIVVGWADKKNADSREFPISNGQPT